MTIGAVLLGIATTCIVESAACVNALHERVEGVAMYRFVRQSLAHDIQYSDREITFKERPPTIRTEQNQMAHRMILFGGRFYRVLSDGQKQPYTGRINNWSDKMYWAEARQRSFVYPEEKACRFHWDGYAYKGQEREKIITMKGVVLPYREYYHMGDPL